LEYHVCLAGLGVSDQGFSMITTWRQVNLAARLCSIYRDCTVNDCFLFDLVHSVLTAATWYLHVLDLRIPPRAVHV
jgi:hypothetical protein